jgi:pseudaminic acid cytidylyltransferase
LTIKVNAIIPARIGSKRIPKKNIKKLNGKPLILHTIDKMVNSSIFTEIYVSTDSEDIQSLVSSSNVKSGTLRPKNLADDFTPILEVVKYEINSNPQLFSPNSVLACVFPTSVMLKEDDYVAAFEQFTNGPMSNFLISGAKFPHPIERALIRTETGRFKLADSSMKFTRTQDLPEHYYDLGQFYFALAETWLKAEDVFENCDCYLMSASDVVDIDNPADFKLLEERTAVMNQN